MFGLTQSGAGDGGVAIGLPRCLGPWSGCLPWDGFSAKWWRISSKSWSGRFIAFGARAGAERMPLPGAVAHRGQPFLLCRSILGRKIVPRSLVPMMTSVFYDLPFIRWWMVHVVHAIRVEAATFRREAPELQQAIARLRCGECLVVFPEARLRSSAEVLLRALRPRRWHILREVPETVVVVLWIEGGWGSWASYFKGPPMKNKRMDWWRPIDIAVGEPATLPAALLSDHRSTAIICTLRAWPAVNIWVCRRCPARRQRPTSTGPKRHYKQQARTVTYKGNRQSRAVNRSILVAFVVSRSGNSVY